MDPGSPFLKSLANHAVVTGTGFCLGTYILFRTPVTVLSRGVEKHLGINEKAELHHGDVIKFLPDKFHYGLEIRTDATAANIGTYGSIQKVILMCSDF